MMHWWMCIRIMARNGHQRALNQLKKCYFAYFISVTALTCPLDDSHRGKIWGARITQLCMDFWDTFYLSNRALRFAPLCQLIFGASNVILLIWLGVHCQSAVEMCKTEGSTPHRFLRNFSEGAMKFPASLPRRQICKHFSLISANCSLLPQWKLWRRSALSVRPPPPVEGAPVEGVEKAEEAESVLAIGKINM